MVKLRSAFKAIINKLFLKSFYIIFIFIENINCFFFFLVNYKVNLYSLHHRSIWQGYQFRIVPAEIYRTGQQSGTLDPPVSYRKKYQPYRFGHRYDIFRIPVNTGVPFRVYHYFIYIYVCMYVSMYIYIIINIKVYHKTFPQFRTNYSWF